MAFLQKTWKDRVAEYINRRVLTKEDGTTELVSVERSEGTISQEGDAFSAANMNDLEQRIANEFSEQNKNLDDLSKNFIFRQSEMISFTLIGNNTSAGYKIADMIEIPNGYKIAQVTPILSGSGSGHNSVVKILGIDQNHSNDAINISIRNIGSSESTWYLSVKVLLIKE